MAIPVIDPDTSVQSHRVGDHVFFSPNATNAPTAWSATSLPNGLSIAEATGLISGIPTVAGVFDVRIKCSNASGNSEEILIPWGIEIADFSQDDSVDVDVDVSTGAVTFPGAEDLSGFGKLGDSIVLMVGFKKYETLLDLPIALLRIGFKEFDDEAVLMASDGLFTKVGIYDSTRYRIVCTLDRTALKNIVEGYLDETAQSSILSAIAELEWMASNLDPALSPELLRRSSQRFVFNIGKDLVADSEP